MQQMGLGGETPLGEAKSKVPNSDYHKNQLTRMSNESHRPRHGRRRSLGTTSSAQRGSMSSTATRRAPTGLRGDVGGRGT